eukprot:1345129-Rhodomonas_salina.2
MSGTELAYGATRCYAIFGTELVLYDVRLWCYQVLRRQLKIHSPGEGGRGGGAGAGGGGGSRGGGGGGGGSKGGLERGQEYITAMTELLSGYLSANDATKQLSNLRLELVSAVSEHTKLSAASVAAVEKRCIRCAHVTYSGLSAAIVAAVEERCVTCVHARARDVYVSGTELAYGGTSAVRGLATGSEADARQMEARVKQSEAEVRDLRKCVAATRPRNQIREKTVPPHDDWTSKTDATMHNHRVCCYQYWSYAFAMRCPVLREAVLVLGTVPGDCQSDANDGCGSASSDHPTSLLCDVRY